MFPKYNPTKYDNLIPTLAMNAALCIGPLKGELIPFTIVSYRGFRVYSDLISYYHEDSG